MTVYNFSFSIWKLRRSQFIRMVLIKSGEKYSFIILRSYITKNLKKNNKNCNF